LLLKLRDLTFPFLDFEHAGLNLSLDRGVQRFTPLVNDELVTYLGGLEELTR
jgi:hypothetical protein